MGNVFANLPAAAANGAGAWVDVSAMGAEKSIVVGGTMIGTVNIEITNEAVATSGNPVASIKNSGKACVKVAAHWMRAVVVGYQQGSAPTIEVGANDDGIDSASLPVTAGDGSGASVDVSGLGELKTVTVHGPFRGSVLVEMSNDNVNWAPSFLTFTQPGSVTKKFPAERLRVTRSGVPSVTPGTPIVDVAAVHDGTAPPSFTDPVIFNYTVTGLEPDPSDMMIPLPAARADADYLVVCQQQDVIDGYVFDLPGGGLNRTTTEFRLISSAPLDAAVVLTFIVANPS